MTARQGLEEFYMASENKLIVIAVQSLSPLPNSPLVLPSAHGQAVAWGE